MSLLTYIASIAGAIIGAGVIWHKGLVPAYRFIQRLESMHDDVSKLPEFMADMRDFKESALHELYPNSGGSLKDQVTQMHGMLESHINDAALHNTGPNQVLILNQSSRVSDEQS